MRTLRATAEGVQIAVEALRSNKVRALLTILSVAVGVATVTGMGAVMNGVERGITEAIDSGGRDNFRVARFDPTRVETVRDAGATTNPNLTLAEAEAVARVSTVRSVTPVLVMGNQSVKRGHRLFTKVRVRGLGAGWTSYKRGDFVEGRPYLEAEYARSAPVAVISEALARDMFADASAVGERLRVSGTVFDVIGVFRQEVNVLERGDDKFVYLPATTALKHLPVSESWLELWVVPEPSAGQAQTMDEVNAALRTMRRLKPAQESNFSIIREEAYTELLGRITGAIRLAMMVLASIGLLVGGVGVVGIMLISVTERTREIGVRKAMGARGRDILWQFLVEATTVTVIGALVGLVLGAGTAALLRLVTPIPAVMPLWSALSALIAAAVTGMVFGMYPAWAAARLDPVEALRYE